MNVTVRFFALYRERAGMAKSDWSLPANATLADLLLEIRQTYPNLAPPDIDIVAAVNEEYDDGELTLQEGDEVALIPPVSGGGEESPSPQPSPRTREREKRGKGLLGREYD